MSAERLRRSALAGLGLAAALATPAPAHAWEHNIAVWPRDAFPLPITLRPEDARHTPNATLAEIVRAAFDEWNAVSCAFVELEFAGVEDVPAVVDDRQVLGWVSDADAWIYGSAAAGATQIDVLGPDGPRVDILFNDVTFDWVVGANTFITDPDIEWGVDPNIEVDPASVITHELGHLLGLAHPRPQDADSQPDPLATMVFALLPNAQQASLAADDKLGLCAKYPVPGAHECDSDDDCDDEEYCGTFAAEGVGEVRLCDEWRGTWGDACSRDAYVCGGICRFTALDYSRGYCTDLCAAHADCPDDWRCVALPSTAGTDVNVCEPGSRPSEDVGVRPVDAGDEPVDAGDEQDASADTEVRPPDASADAAADAAADAKEDAGGGPEPDAADRAGRGGGCAVNPVGDRGPACVLLVLALLGRREAKRAP